MTTPAEQPSWFQNCFGTNWQIDLMIVALVLMLPGALIFMWRIQRAVNDLDFSDWFRGPNGKASWKEVQGMGGFIVGTWCMVYTTISAKVPDGYVLLLLVYLAVCIGSPTAVSIIARMWPSGAASPPPVMVSTVTEPSGTTTTTTAPVSGGS